MKNTVNPIDYRRYTNVEWKQTHMECAAIKFNAKEGPLWRVRLTANDKEKTYVISFGFHHGCFDGLSSMKIEGVFMDVLNGVIDGQEIDLEETSLSPSMDSHIPKTEKSFKLRDFLQFYDLVKEQLYGYRSPYLQVYNQPLKQSQKSDLNFHMIEFKDKDFVNLLKISKQKGVTVNTTLTMIALVAMARMLRESSDGCEFSFRCYFAFSLRAFLPKDMFYHGMYTLFYPITDYLINLECQEFWKTASDMSEDVNVFFKSKRIWDQIRVWWKIIKIMDRATEIVIKNNHNKWDFFFTNLGNASSHIKAENKYTNVKSICPSVYFPGTETLWTHAFVSIQKCLTWTIIFDTKRISMAQTEKYAALIRQTFEKYIPDC